MWSFGTHGGPLNTQDSCTTLSGESVSFELLYDVSCPLATRHRAIYIITHGVDPVYSIEHFHNLMSMGTVDITPVSTLKLDMPLSLSSQRLSSRSLHYDCYRLHTMIRSFPTPFALPRRCSLLWGPFTRRWFRTILSKFKLQPKHTLRENRQEYCLLYTLVLTPADDTAGTSPRCGVEFSNCAWTGRVI